MYVYEYVGEIKRLPSTYVRKPKMADLHSEAADRDKGWQGKLTGMTPSSK